MVDRIPRDMGGGGKGPRPLGRRRFMMPALLMCLMLAVDGPARLFGFVGPPGCRPNRRRPPAPNRIKRTRRQDP